MRPALRLARAATLVVATATAARAQATVVAATPLGRQLDSTLRAAETRGFSGVVRVERGGTVLLEKGYGLANRETRTPFTPATVVQIGSNTKDFTLVELLRLQARGKLSLADSLGHFFPDAPADKRGITLRQLSEHMGGFPIGFGGDFERLTREEFIARAFAAPLRATPGTQHIYSNAGYAILAAVIEQVTGKSYDVQVRDDILAPLGLHRTGYLLPGFDPARVAHGYDGGTDRGSILDRPHAADGPWWNLRGNGGMLSTVDDMHAFYAALFGSDRLLSRAERSGRFDPDQPVGLAGSDLVNFFLFERFPRERTELILATNDAAHRAPEVARELERLLGLPGGGDRRGPMAAGPTQGPPPGAPAPDERMAGVLRDFVATVNAGDSAAIDAFIAARFSVDGPPAAQRAARLRTMHERLGALVLGAMWIAPDGAVAGAIATANEGPATVLLQLEPGPPFRIRAVGMLVGG